MANSMSLKEALKKSKDYQTIGLRKLDESIIVGFNLPNDDAKAETEKKIEAICNGGLEPGRYNLVARTSPKATIMRFPITVGDFVEVDPKNDIKDAMSAGVPFDTYRESLKQISDLRVKNAQLEGDCEAYKKQIALLREEIEELSDQLDDADNNTDGLGDDAQPTTQQQITQVLLAKLAQNWDPIMEKVLGIKPDPQTQQHQHQPHQHQQHYQAQQDQQQHENLSGDEY